MTASSFNSRPFKLMPAGEKARFVGQLVVFICTFGFIYPTLLHSDEYVTKYQ